MRRLLLAGALLALATVPAAGAGVFPYRHETHTLENGLKVVLVPLPGRGLVSYYSVVRTGSRDEVEAGHTGFAHFFEHMMFRGTERFPGPVYDSLTTALGARTNAFTSDDLTCYYLTVAAGDLPTVIDVEADRFQNLQYPEQEFQTEAGAVYGEYRKNRTQPFSVLLEALRERAFDAHTYKHTTMGFEKDIAAMPTMFDYSKRFFARYYRPENVVVLVIGDFDPARTLALLRRHYGGWKSGYVAPAVQPEPEQTAERTVDVAYDGRTLPIVTMAWKSPAFDPSSRDYAAGWLLGELVFGETSDLYRDLVLDRRLVQRMFTMFPNNRDPGLWGVSTMVGKEDDIQAVRDAIDAAVARLQATPPDATTLDDLKKRTRYSFLMGMDTTDRIAGALVRLVAITGGIEAADAFYTTLDQVTPEDVRAAAARLLTRERRTVAVLKGVRS
jgi:zinc protease